MLPTPNRLLTLCSGFFNKATEDAVFSNVIDLLFNCAAFIYIGAFIPFDQFQQAASGVSLFTWQPAMADPLQLTVWRLVVLAICILLFRRLPVILALYRWIPDIKTFREAAFTGWFGESRWCVSRFTADGSRTNGSRGYLHRYSGANRIAGGTFGGQCGASGAPAGDHPTCCVFPCALLCDLS